MDPDQLMYSTEPDVTTVHTHCYNELVFAARRLQDAEKLLGELLSKSKVSAERVAPHAPVWVRVDEFLSYQGHKVE